VLWPFRSRDWKQQTRRVFQAEDAESGHLHRIVLTNAGILTFEGRQRVYVYAKPWRRDPAAAIARAWGFTNVVEIAPGAKAGPNPRQAAIAGE
jgi:hypothetical protein